MDVVETRNNEEENHSYRRVETPIILQMEEIECGVACLASILGYYGKWISLEELRAACDVSRAGANITNILLAAGKYGLEASENKLDFSEVVRQEVPFIVNWQHTHLLIVEGFSKSEVLLNDPAHGVCQVSYQEFQKAYGGLCLTFKPSASFVQSGKPRKFSHELWKSMQTIKKPMRFLFLSGILLACLQLMQPGFFRFFVDFVMGGGYLYPVWVFLGIFLGFILVMLLVTYLQSWMLTRIYLKLSISYASRFFWHLLHLPVQFYAQRYGSEIANRLPLVDAASKIFTNCLEIYVINFFIVVVIGIAMFFFNPLIASLGILSMLVIVWLISYLHRLRRDTYALAQKQSMVFYSNLIEILESIETIQVLGLKYKVLSKLSSSLTRMLNPGHQLLLSDIILSIIPGFLQSLVMVVILILGSYLIIHGQMTSGMLLALQMLMVLFFSPILKMADLQQEIQVFQMNFNRIDEVLRNPVERIVDGLSITEEGGKPMAKLNGEIDIHNLQFSFSPNSAPVLKDIYLNITPGKCIALVGPTGSGKSTLARIIAGLFPERESSILFDKKPRSAYPHKVMTNSIGMVEQHPILFRDTIWNNITMMDPTFPQEEVFWAAQNACIHDEIVSKKNGYGLVLESGGSNLSGGQRQRVEIARVILRKPVILILDEATSMLDSKTESKIISNIRRLGCACIVIAHRLSTISNCDEIVVMSHGQIIQKGTHDELKVIAGLYKDFLY